MSLRSNDVRILTLSSAELKINFILPFAFIKTAGNSRSKVKTREKYAHSPGSHQPLSQNYTSKKSTDTNIRWLNLEWV